MHTTCTQNGVVQWCPTFCPADQISSARSIRELDLVHGPDLGMQDGPGPGPHAGAHGLKICQGGSSGIVNSYCSPTSKFPDSWEATCLHGSDLERETEVEHPNVISI